MFCEKCGAKVEKGQAFCPTCGSRINEQINTNNSLDANNFGNNIVETKKLSKKSLTAIIISATSVIMIAIIISLVIVFTGRISMKNYINYDAVQINGYTGYATVDYENIIDYNNLINDLGDYEYSGYWFQDDVALSGEEEMLTNCIDIVIPDCGDNSHWSNGDTFTIQINVNYNKINGYNFDKKLVGNKDGYSKEFTIKELPEAIIINPFEMIESVDYDTNEKSSAINYIENYNKNYESFNAHYYKEKYGNPSLEIKDSNSESLVIIPFYDNSNSYKSTNKINVRINFKEDYLVEYGIILYPTSKDYDPNVIDLISETPKTNSNTFNDLKKLADDYVKSHSNYTSKYEYAFFGYDDNDTFFGSDDNDTYPDKNFIAFVYSDIIDGGEKKYKYVCYNNVKIYKSDSKIFNAENLDISKNFLYFDNAEDAKGDFPLYDKITDIK